MSSLRRFLVAAVCGLLAGSAVADGIRVDRLEVTGNIEGENVRFRLELSARSDGSAAALPLVEGRVASIGSPRFGQGKLVKTSAGYALELARRAFSRPADIEADFTFASLPEQDGEWRQTRFAIPRATVRRLTMVCDREDLEVVFPGALRVDRGADAEGRMTVTAYLGADADFVVRWKPRVQRLEADLVVSCDASTIARASVGALRLDTVFSYRVVQGALTEMELNLPDDLNVTQVAGADLREWQLVDREGGGRALRVRLNRPKEDRYLLQVESERALDRFPCRFDLPVIEPAGVVRTSGFLHMGTDSAIKLVVHQARGLTQVDPAAFPDVRMDKDVERARPQRSAYAYQYAGMPYTLALSADDIVASISSEERLVLALRDSDLVFDATAELEIRDAPIRELMIETDPGWIVARVEGSSVGDYDLRDEGGRRMIKVFFKEEAMGRTVVRLRMERSLEKGAEGFVAPRFRVEGVRTARGFIVLGAEKGVRLKPEGVEALREVQSASLPVRVEGAQQAYRYKTADWRLGARIESAHAAVYCEIFHLASLGEGVLFGSSALTYHIAGAPVRELRLRIPESCQNVEFSGRDIRAWERDGDLWTIFLQEKILGDYTLLVTYDHPYTYEGDRIAAGGLSAMDVETETGYVVLAGPASLRVEDEQRDPSLLAIDRAELPEAYALLINDPVLRAYRYVASPHAVRLGIRHYPTSPLLSQVVDSASLSTRVSEEGERVTTATLYVKNASGQHLGLALPEGARLWSASVDGQLVQALDTRSAGGDVLIPLERHADPNQPSRVELVYAESAPKLGWFSALSLRAPTAAAQSVFAEWKMVLPEGRTVAWVGGPLKASDPVARCGLAPLGLLVVRSVWVVGWAWWVLAAGFALAVGGLLFHWARGRHRAVAALLGVPVFALLGAGVVARLVGGPSVVGPLAGLFATAGGEFTFHKVVSLADSPLQFRLWTAPAWVGGLGSPAALALLPVVGLIVLRRSRGAALRALAFVLIVWGLAQSQFTMNVVAGFVLAGLPLALVVGLGRLGLRAGRRARVESPAADRDGPLPLAADAERPSATPTEAPVPPPIEPLPDSGGREGGASILFLLVLALVGVGLGVWPALADEEPQGAAPCFLEEVKIVIEASPELRNEEAIARLRATLRFEAEAAMELTVLEGPFVLSSYELGSRHLALEPAEGGYVLRVARKGRYEVSIEYLARVMEREGRWSMPVDVPPALRNEVRLRLPRKNMEVRSPQAVLLERREVEEGVEVLAVFGPGRAAEFAWEPATRKPRLETAAAFCEMNTYGSVEPGVVNLVHWIRLQIAQGEMQAFAMDVPAHMSVTAVRAPGLSTWRYDPEAGLLEALLEKPVSGDVVITVQSQLPQEGLPYTAKVDVPRLRHVLRQRGSIALAAADTVQFQVEAVEGLNPMNLGDFSAEAAAAAQALRRGSPAPTIRRAFRYQQLPLAATIQASAVLPEIRVEQQASFDISEERMVLSSRIKAVIAKAGVFALELLIPDDYDVESLSGADVSHWDEVREDGHVVRVHFLRQVIGEQTLNVVLARTEKGIERALAVPRIRVRGELKHVGTLLVSSEHGVRLLTASRDGATEVNPRELGEERPGLLAYRLLRPDWAIALQSEVADPSVKAETLHRVEVQEGMLLGRSHIHYAIENAGVKAFRLRAPAPGVSLTVQGADIQQVRETDREQGLWLVELRGKVEKSYALEISYQMPFESASGRVRVVPVQALDAEAQKGHLVLFSGGRLQVREAAVSDGLRLDNTRNIPAHFGAGDCSDGILCYRATRAEVSLDISVLRHAAAEVLPATVRNVRLTSVVSEDGAMVTEAVVEVQVGDLRFLRAELPKGSRVWCMFVNGKPVTPLVEADELLIPMEVAGRSTPSKVELIYGGLASAGWSGWRSDIEGPRFNLPLSDVEWTLYMPPRALGVYLALGGTLRPREEADVRLARFDARRYAETAEREVAGKLQIAEQVLKEGEELARQGRQREARAAFEAALNYSQGQADFNEDARVQYRNLARQQAVVGLYNRRESLKVASNVAAPAPAQELEQVEQGQWTAAYGKQVEQSLGAEENAALGELAEKILDQQAAASGSSTAIEVTLPRQGRVFVFHRDVQITPKSPMTVAFTTLDRRLAQGGASAALAAGLWLVLVLALRRASPQRPVGNA